MIKRISRFFLITVTYTLIFSCNQAIDNTDIETFMDKNHPRLNNKKLEFGNDLYSTNFDSFEFKGGNSKIIFTGLMSCSSCVLRLKDIQELADKRFQKTQVIYIGIGERNEYFDYQVKKNNFSYPVIIDESGTFISGNNIEELDESAFFVNGNNEIKLIGSPIQSEELLIFYQRLISSSK